MPSYTCARCLAVFASNNERRAHVHLVHGSLGYRYPCLVCGEEFTSESARDLHAADHTFNDAREMLGAMETAQEATNPAFIPYDPRQDFYSPQYEPDFRRDPNPVIVADYQPESQEPFYRNPLPQRLTVYQCNLCGKWYDNRHDREVCQLGHHRERINETKQEEQAEPTPEFNQKLSIRSLRKEGL